MTDIDNSQKDATATTAEVNAAVVDTLPFADRSDFERAVRGRIAEPSSPQVVGDSGWPVWNLDDFEFLDGEAPPTVNPSLWRQAQLNRLAGLFEVAEGFYQVRGLDLANVTFVAGDTGWIVIDPLTSAETARAAHALVTEHLGDRPIHAVIYTHSHVDHFAGVRGVVDEADVAAGKVQIMAPAGFLEAAVSENVIAGNVMSRRASYMYGATLPKGPKGHVDAGLGKGIPIMSTAGLIAPSEEITTTGTERVIDGVRIVFQLTPGTEAPAEMNFFFPDHRVLCMAENCTATFHNVYTPRGAQVRDALGWSKYIDESIELYAADADVLFASHHWPRWGRDEVVEYLSHQRDAYRFLHDQTMRLANKGLTMLEIAEEMRLPHSLSRDFHLRDYYGTVSHNTKAVYQRYLGWFDANPAHLHPHPPQVAARRYVEFMGGADEVLRRARECFDDGDYRWVAEVVNHVVFADPENSEAKALQADALEQMGYQAESGPWRAFYLTGAQELRSGPLGMGSPQSASPDVVKAMTVEMLLDFLGVRLDGFACERETLSLHLVVTDRLVDGRPEEWGVGINHGALHAVAGRAPVDAELTVTATHGALAAMVLGSSTIEEQIEAGAVVLDGDRGALERLIGWLDTFEFWFDIVTP